MLIEQAKGNLVQRHNEGLDQAFARLRPYARAHGQRSTTVARRVIAHELDLT